MTFKAKWSAGLMGCIAVAMGGFIGVLASGILAALIESALSAFGVSWAGDARDIVWGLLGLCFVPFFVGEAIPSLCDFHRQLKAEENSN